MPRIGLDFVLAHIPQISDPLSAASPWYVLIEATAGAQFGLRAAFERALSADMGLVSDGVIAESEAQRAHLWRLRESMSEAQKPEGGSIKHDVSVPIARIPEFLKAASAAVEKLAPGARPLPFGHIGDGNIHFNISVPKGADNAAFLARWEQISRAVHDVVHRFGGSISAEHGLGVMKHNEIVRYKSRTELEVMGALKRTLDPKNILNPGKVLPDQAAFNAGGGGDVTGSRPS
jgi:FAD/FMN-containing dehydrogenase